MNKEIKDDNEQQNRDRIENESDAAKLARLHLEDEDHVITDEDMRNIKIGVVSETDTTTEEAIEESDDKIADRKADNDDDEIPGGQKVTTWDVINP